LGKGCAFSEDCTAKKKQMRLQTLSVEKNEIDGGETMKVQRWSTFLFLSATKTNACIDSY
jgi:hypothetical protein